jgi:hypothetical protein
MTYLLTRDGLSLGTLTLHDGLADETVEQIASALFAKRIEMEELESEEP